VKRRAVHPIAVMVAEERGVVLLVAAEQGVSDAEDLVHDAVIALLRQVARGTFVLRGDEHGMRATIRAYLVTTARRLAWRQLRRASLERGADEPPDAYDPLPTFEARSELRALDLSPTALATFQIVAFEGTTACAARRLGLRPATLYTRLRALRADARAARRRLK
jgi:DNA-directed RNA polymerase specialized sigma24 family protein